LRLQIMQRKDVELAYWPSGQVGSQISVP
jgi:hypothetical protein